MSKYTKPGLLLLIIGSILALIGNIVFFLLNGVSLTLSSIGGIGGLLSFVGIILLIIGRKEFGERHRKFVIFALILFILSVIIPTIIIAGLVFAYVSSAMSNGGDFSSVQNIFYIIPLASIIGGLAYILLLYELENKIGRYVLFLAFAITIIVSLLVAVNIGTAWNDTLGTIDFENLSPTDPEYTQKMDEFTQQISSSGLYSIPNGILMLIALIIPYKRISSGELLPVTAKSTELTKKCPNCGWDISSDTDECPHCNFKINN